MDQNDNEVRVPVVTEEVRADAIPVQTGGVRVTRRVEPHEAVLEQELRKGRVEVKRVKTDRIVDGPQPAGRVGNTLVVPVVSEVLRVEKQWVVTEEIHITQLEERETVQQKVTVNQEQAVVERLDSRGNAVSSIEAPESLGLQSSFERSSPTSLLNRGRNDPSL
jgi:stress response protein YsnF